MFEGFRPWERSHEQELEISGRSVQFLGPESLCGPSYEGLKELHYVIAMTLCNSYYIMNYKFSMNYKLILNYKFSMNYK